MKRVIVAGSVRTEGKTTALAVEIFEASIEDNPQNEAVLIPLSELEIFPCQACDACKEEDAECVKEADGAAEEATVSSCIYEDDMLDLYAHIAEADEFIIVAPVYFSGPSATLKAFLDKLQPFFWQKTRHTKHAPATLHLVGEQGNPFGYEALISCVGCALYTAGFALDTVYDWTGCFDDQNNVIAQGKQITNSKTLKTIASLLKD